MEPWVADYIGIPYLEHGRDRAGCDCWGLVRLVLAEQFGRNLPDLGDEYGPVEADLTSRLIDSTKPLVEADQVRAWKPGDIAVVKVLGIPSHVGVVVGPWHMLHVQRGTAAHVARLDSAKYVHRLEGVYRVL